MMVSKEEVQISDVLGKDDYTLGESVHIEDNFSIKYDGTPIKKDLAGVDLAVQLSINFNVELTDLVTQYLACRLSDTNIQVDDKEIENPTKEKIDEAFKEVIENK